MEFILIVLAELGAFFQSLYYTLKAWGGGIAWLILGLLALTVAFRLLASLSGRLKLVRKLSDACRKAGCELRVLRSPLYALFHDTEGPDLSFTVGEKTYEIRFCAGFVKGSRAYFTGEGKVRLESFFVIRRRRSVGLTAPEDKNTERVLLFSPTPKGFFEETVVRGQYRDVYDLDCGSKIDGILVFDQKGFLGQTERILDGYVVTYDTRAHEKD